MKSEFPKMMIHPAFVKGTSRKIEGNDPNSGRKFVDYQGTPDRYPPVEVRDHNEEAYYRAKGYYIEGEPPMKATDYAEFPKMMEHPKFEEAILAQPEIKAPNGTVLQQQRENKPAKFPPITVNTKAEEEAWGKKGYKVKGISDPEAVQRAAAVPHDPNRLPPSEYPKMVDGVLVQDPHVETGFQEYPKWIGDVLVNTRAEELALRPPKTPAEIEAERKAAAKARLEAAKAELEAAEAEMKDTKKAS